MRCGICTKETTQLWNNIFFDLPNCCDSCYEYIMNECKINVTKQKLTEAI